MIKVFAMTGDDEQRLDEHLQRRPGDFVLHLRIANDDFLIRFECIQDHLGDIFAVVDVEETHERLDACLNHVVIFREELFLDLWKEKS